jgi:hypothetical protein
MTLILILLSIFSVRTYSKDTDLKEVDERSLIQHFFQEQVKKQSGEGKPALTGIQQHLLKKKVGQYVHFVQNRKMDDKPASYDDFIKDPGKYYEEDHTAYIKKRGYIESSVLINLDQATGNAQQVLFNKPEEAMKLYDSLIKKGAIEKDRGDEVVVHAEGFSCTKFFESAKRKEMVKVLCSLGVTPRKDSESSDCIDPSRSTINNTSIPGKDFVDKLPSKKLSGNSVTPQ